MYSKIFTQIFDSSLAEDYQTRHVFMDLLVLADPEGQVDMTAEAIARRTNIPIDVIHVSICKLCKPDVKSRTSTADGRRLLPLDDHRDWGWQIVNYAMYHKMKTPKLRREYMRAYMTARREKEKASKQSVNMLTVNVNESSHGDGDGDYRSSFSETESPSSETQAPGQAEIEESDPILATFPCDGKLPKWDLRQSYFEQLKRLYPSLDMEEQIRKAWGWIDANPRKRKTHDGMKAFMINWMNRDVNKRSRYD